MYMPLSIEAIITENVLVEWTENIEGKKNNLRRKNPAFQSYSRSRPYGRDSITTNTDPLEKLKEIAGYDNHSRSQSFAIFDPETMEHGKDCKYF